MPFAKKHFFSLLFLFCFSLLFGQKKQIAIKLSANIARSGVANGPTFNPNIETELFTGVAPALIIFNEKKSSYQEFEFSRLSLKKEENPSGEIKFLMFDLRYEYGRITRHFNDMVNLRLGGSLGLHHGSSDFMPRTTQGYPSESKGTGASLSFTPHLDINISDRLFIDFNPSLALLYFGIEQSDTKNPTLPQRQQEQSGFDLAAGGFLLRLGIGYKL